MDGTNGGHCVKQKRISVEVLTEKIEAMKLDKRKHTLTNINFVVGYNVAIDDVLVLLKG